MAEQPQQEQGEAQQTGEQERPVPRDLPDQQAGPGEDPWDVVPGHPVDAGPDEGGVPDTDEAGSGPQGAPRSGTVQSDHPTPEEPSA